MVANILNEEMKFTIHDVTGTAVTWLLLNDENKKKEQTRRSTKTFG